MQRGELIAQEESHDILALKWRDTRDVFLFSNKHGSAMEKAYVGTRGRPVPAANAPSTSIAARASYRRAKFQPKALTGYKEEKANISCLTNRGLC